MKATEKKENMVPLNILIPENMEGAILNRMSKLLKEKRKDKSVRRVRVTKTEAAIEAMQIGLQQLGEKF